MTPYYDDGQCVIYHGDCREVLRLIDADVLITDPPYGVNLVARKARNVGGGSHDVAKASTTYADDPDEIAALIREVMPVALGRVRRGLVFCGTSMLWNYPPARAVGAVYIPAGCGYTPWGFQTSQPILFYGACPYLEHGEGNRPNGFIPKSVYPAEKIDHPCPKPLEWMTWAVNRVSRLGETVLDPFMGSGTTMLAARLDGRKSVGIEMSERYCEIAAKRLAQGVLAL